MKRFLPLLALLAASSAVAAEPAHDHSAHAPVPASPNPHAGHTMPEEAAPAADPHADHQIPAAPKADADPHAGHDMPATAQATEPEPPTDFAADHIFGAEAMYASRTQLYREHGGEPTYKILLSTAEYAAARGHDGYHWEGEAWYGGDLNRIVAKSKGEGSLDDGLKHAEFQLLYSRAISPYFDLQAGIRHDFEPKPSRTYAALGFEGLAPYWFEVEGTAFLSEKGQVSANLSVSYDQLVTQRMVLEPRAELKIAAQNVPELGMGSGLSQTEVGLRLRYDISRQFSPYIGVSYERKVGNTGDLARLAGEHVENTRFVAGLRAWF